MVISKLKFLLLFIFLIIRITDSVAQQNKIDSVKYVIDTAKFQTTIIDSYYYLGNIYWNINQDTARYYLIKCKETAELFIETNTDSNLTYIVAKYLGRVLNDIGLVYEYQGNDSIAMEYYYTDIKVCEEYGFKRGIASSYNNIGFIYKNRGNTIRALNYFKKSLKMKQEIGDKKGIAISYNNIGFIYERQGDIKEALEYYLKSLAIKKELGNKKGIATSLNNIGFIYKSQGDIPKAIDYYNKSSDIFKSLNDKEGVSNSYNNIGGIYDDQGDNSKALEYYNNGLVIVKEMKYQTGIARAYNNIGRIYLKQDDIPKALEYYNKSFDIFDKIGEKHGIAGALNNLGKVYYRKNDTIKAEENFRKSLKLFEEIGYKGGIATNLYNLGELKQKQNNIKQFNEYADTLYKVAKELGYPNDIKDASLLMRIKNITAHNYIEADSYAYEIMDINNKSIYSNFAVLPEAGQEKFFQTVSSSYMDFYSYALFRKKQNPDITQFVMNNVIKNKGILLKSSTAMRNAILSSNDSVLIENYYKWIYFKKLISKNYSLGKNTDSLEYLANESEKELVKKSQIFSNFKNLEKIKWQDIQKGLKPNEIAIEFINFSYKDYNNSSFWNFTDSVLYCALIIDKNCKNPEMIPLFEEKQLEKIIGKFGGNNYSYINSIYGKNTDENTQLYNLIWAPIDSFFNSLSFEKSKALKVYISPDGLLHKISFSAIAKKQDVYLCDVYDIELKSSTGKIIENKNVTQNRKYTTATLFGGINYNTDSTKQKVWNYLEGTKTETQKIDKILKKASLKVNYYTSNLATEEEFKLMANSSNIIHVATHGFFYPDPKEVEKETKKKVEYGNVIFRGGGRGFGVNTFINNKNPLMRSGLVFAGANDVWSKKTKNDSIDDGVLTAQEVANIDMRKTDLVVMSACETGLGDIKGSEGVYGLQRAFKIAGVKYEIMSLWQVPDKETEEFMTTFYKKLVNNNDIKQAFADTQKEMRKKYNPYFWAAFVLID